MARAATSSRHLPRTRTSEYEAGGITFSGGLLFLIGLSFVGSGFTSARVQIAGLSVHPYLLILSIVFPLITPSRFNRIPLRLFFSLLTFATLFYLSTFAGGVAVNEGVKMAAAVVTILTFFMLVERHHDYELGALGLIIAVSLLGIRGLAGGVDVSRGVEVIESANRNSYSLYALGPILMCGHILLTKRVSLLAKIIYTSGIVISSLVVFLSLNRSGWVGIVVILMMLLWRKHFKAALLIGVVVTALMLIITTFFQSNSIIERMGKSKNNQSDEARVNLVLWSFEMALENPLLGVSPQVLEYRLALAFGYERGAFATHNVYAYIAGGSGLLCFAALFWVGRVLWTWPPAARATAVQLSAFMDARRLLRMVVILWAVRGFFTHEILFSPGFCATIGLAAGLCKASQRRD